MRALRSNPFLAALTAVLGILAAVPATGQEPDGDDWQPLESFDEEISVDVTNLEVWVTDADGRPVTDLTAADFVLSEDRERVEITHFSSYEAEEAGSWSGSGVGAQGDGEAPDPSAIPIAGLENRLHLAIFVDALNLPLGNRERIFDDLRDLIRENLGPPDRAMILAHDGSLALLQEPTGDRDALLGALGRIERSVVSNLELENERQDTYREMMESFSRPGFSYDHENGMPADAPCAGNWHALDLLATRYSTAVFARAQRTGGALVSASRLLAGVPGRKALLYVGGGLPQQAGLEMWEFLTHLCPPFQPEIVKRLGEFDVTRVYDEVARQTNASSVTLYAAEVYRPRATTDVSLGGTQGGMTPKSGGWSASIPQGMVFRPSPSAIRSGELDDEAGLFFLANETGGRAILNANDLSGDIELLTKELRTYYSLGFEPEHGGDGRLHDLEVELARGVGKGYRVRHRRSYRDTPYDQRMALAIQGVAQLGTEANRMNVRVETGNATATGAGWRVPIRVWVPLDRMTLVAAGDGAARTGRLRVMMAVSDAAGNLGPVRQKLVTVEVAEDVASAAGPNRAHLVEVDLDLPTDNHVVALGLRDELGGETSFLRHEVRLGTETMARIDMEEE
jgi:VWFA-related protein